MSNSKAYLYSPDGETFSSHKADFGFLKEAFEINQTEIVEVFDIPKTDRAFVVIPGYEAVGKEDEISKQISNVDRVILFVTADEGGFLDVDRITHNNMEVWIQSAFKKHSKYNGFPIGAPSTMSQHLPEYTPKTNDVFFSGQITHQRRKELATALRKMKTPLFNPTSGFMQGYSPEEYYRHMAESRISPAPAGNITIDSFRFYEALEMLSIPIGDMLNSSENYYDFYGHLFKDLPIKRTESWRKLPAICSKILEKPSENLHEAVAWWIKYKRDFRYKIMEQLNEH